jgi:hypothetical protein
MDRKKLVDQALEDGANIILNRQRLVFSPEGALIFLRPLLHTSSQVPTREPDRLYIYHHLGLGDHMVCNGMVRHLLENSPHKKVGVFAKSNYFSLVEHMYREDPRIKIIKVGKTTEFEDVAAFLDGYNCDNFIIVGHQYFNAVPESAKRKQNCWEIFYDLVNIPREVRNQMFYIEREPEAEENLLKKLNPNNEPFIFVHDDPERGFHLDLNKVFGQGFTEAPNIKIIRNDPSVNLFYFLKIIEKAEQVHCMESSFKCLIDSWEGKRDGLFFHELRSTPLGQTNLPWKRVKYT